MNIPKKVIWHHSLTKDNIILKDFDAIKRYHIDVNHWNNIGYHYVIEYKDKKLIVTLGRDIKIAGAHTLGQNECSIGICVVGNFDKDVPTNDIYEFCSNFYINNILPKFGRIPNERHNKYSNKSCPGKNFDLTKIDYLIDLYQKNLTIKTEFDKELEWLVKHKLISDKKDKLAYEKKISLIEIAGLMIKSKL